VDQYVSFVTLAVRDRDASRRFYVDGLGWTPAFDDVDVIFFRVGPGLVLSLWDEAGFRAEVGEPSTGPAPMTLAHNVGSDEEVDAVLAAARAAGARAVHDAQRRGWGGYTGYFEDPDGFRWEVAHGPGELQDEVVAAGRAWAERLGARGGRVQP
jgi:catechol 2,3-dioxygenase-like lactoylglutathione lyase family enzyme